VVTAAYRESRSKYQQPQPWRERRRRPAPDPRAPGRITPGL